MSNINITEVKDESFGKCLKISNDVVELLVTLDFGPRIIHYSLVSKENMFYQDKSCSCLGDKFEIYGDQIKLYGGHRLWIAPEIMPHCYHPDNNPVTVKRDGDKISFIAPIEKFTNVQKTITISLDTHSSKVEVYHSIKNCGLWDITVALWSLTMVDTGSKEILPLPKRKTGLLPNRNLVFWDYSSLNDERVYYGNEFITLTQDPQFTNPFKLGYNNEEGWAACFNKGQLFIKSFPVNENGAYPDGGCCYETYTNDLMMEMESLGELQTLHYNSIISHKEMWELHEVQKVPSNDEKEIKEVLGKFIIL